MMKNLITVLCLAFAANLFAQQEAHSLVDNMPYYKACEERTNEKELRLCAEREMKSFITRHAEYGNVKAPRADQDIVVRFVVQPDGSLSEAFAYVDGNKKLSEANNKAIKKIFADMPAWVAGTHKGVTVPVALVVPVRFD